MHATRGAILTSLALAATTIGAVFIVTTAALRGGTGEARATPAPLFTDIDAASRADILAYARSLSFSSLHGQSDTRRLSPPCHTCPSGPIARIEPETGVHLMTIADMASGRIIGREINLDTVSTPELAPGDTTYLWVDSLGGHWRTISVPTRTDRPVVFGTLVVTRHPELNWKEPLARWLWTPQVGVTDNESSWFGCPTGCCTKQRRRIP